MALHLGDHAAVKLDTAVEAGARRDPAAPPTEGDASVRRGSEVVDHRPRVGDALAARPAQLGDHVGDRLGDHHVTGGDGEPPAQLAVAGQRRAGREHGGAGAHAARDRCAPRRPGPPRSAAGPASPRRWSTPRCVKARAKPERQACRLDSGGRRVEGPGAEDRRVAAGPHLGLGERLAGARDAQLRAGVGDRLPGAVVGRSRGDLKVAAGAVPGVHPLFAAPASDPLDCLLCRPCEPQRGAVAEAPSKRRQAEPHRVHEAAVAPAGARRRSGRTPAGPPAPPARARRETTLPTSPCIRRPPRRRRPRGLPRAGGAPGRARPPPATSHAPCAWSATLTASRRASLADVVSGALSETTRRRGLVELDQLALDVARLAVGSAAGPGCHPSRAPRRWCCPRGSGPAGRAAGRGSSSPRPG